MRKISLLVFLMLICFISNLKAQDTIFLKNGSLILSKISEIGPGRIKYKMQANPDGPDYLLEKSKVTAIHFKNGFVQEYNTSENAADKDDIEYINDVPVKKRIEIREERIVYDPQDLDRNNLPIKMNQKYKTNKLTYNSSMYISQPGDPYNPTVSGLASFFIPGLGQMLCGETARGLGFLGGFTGSYMVCLSGLVMAQGNYNWADLNYPGGYYNDKSELGAGLFLVGGVAMMATYIWSIFDAVKVAKVNNMYMQDLRKNHVSIQLKPYIDTKTYPNITDKPVGMTLKINF